MLVFMMGIMFELPLLAALFSKLGLLTRTFSRSTGGMPSSSF